MRFLLIIKVASLFAVLILLQGCKAQIPEHFIIPQSINSENRPVILNYVWMNGCIECQLSDASRWVRRQIDLQRMGDDYKAKIICILSTSNQSDEELVYKYCTSLNSSDVHFISSRDTISVFCKQNSIRRPRRSFTCLLDYEGNVLIKGGMPQKDMESFKHYSLCIQENQYRNN